jgi:heme exporter protein B
MNAARAVLRREFQLASARGLEWLLPPVFYVITVTLFGLGARANDPLLTAFAPAILWVGALLAGLLSLERLFGPDHEDGTLEQCYVSPTPPWLILAMRLLAHWLLTGLPLALLAAPLGAALGLEPRVLPVLVAGLLLGTPLLSLIGGLAASLTVGLPRAGVLLPILVLPLVTPVVIFGAGSVRAAQAGLDAAPPLYFLAAVLALAATLIPWACAAALRNALD